MIGRLVLCGLLIATVCSAWSKEENDIEEVEEAIRRTFMNKDEMERMKIMCTFMSHSQHRTGKAKFMPENIDVTLCTHILYNYARIDNGKIIAGDRDDQSTHGKKGTYEMINDLKEKNPEMKTLLTVGTPGHCTQQMIRVLATSETRTTFIDDTITYLRKNNFNGVNIDCNCLNEVDCPIPDKEKMTQLIKEMKEAFTKESLASVRTKLILTITIPGDKKLIDDGYDIKTICQYVDMMMVKTFNMIMKDDMTTTMHSPLKTSPSETGMKATLNQDWVMRYLMQKGAIEQKLIMGLAFYGRSFTLKNPENHNIGDPITGSGKTGPMTNMPGFLSSCEICENMRLGWKMVYEPVQKSCYAYHDDQWVGFDNRKSMQEKAEYIKDMRLGGAMIMSMDMDDFNGTCCNEGKFPLLKIVCETLGRMN